MKLFLDINDIPSKARVLIYGQGKAALNVLNHIRTERPDVRVPCLLDSFTSGSTAGLPVHRRDELSTLHIEWDIILVASAWWRDIVRDLHKEGWREVHVAALPLWHKYVYSIREMDEATPSFNTVEAMLATDQDREIYRLLVACRRENSALVNMDEISPMIAEYAHVRETIFKHLTEQYLDFVVRNRISTVLHAGVFDGTDCLRFLDALPNLSMIHGFEPQGTSAIEPNVLDTIEHSNKVEIYPQGLWSDTRALPLAGSGPCAALEPNMRPVQATGYVNTVSIDEFMAENNLDRIDYICLDVEGAELHVLNGARRTIESHRPQIAVCIYHLKEDIFQIPISLKQHLDGYIFRIGHYSNGLHETVIYAIPEEILY